MRNNKITLLIFVAMLLGIVVGAYVHSISAIVNGNADASFFTDKISIATKIFLNLIKMIIGPLVLSSLVVGIAKLGDIKVVGRVGGKTMAWFIFATIISLSLGMLLINLFNPGSSIQIPLPDQSIKNNVVNASLNMQDFVSHIFPTSIFKALAENEILEIIVFAIFFGVACASMPKIAEPILKALDGVTHLMLKITHYVMNFAPVAVFAAISSTVAQNGLGVLLTFGKLIGEFYFGLALLWLVLIFLGFLFVKKRIGNLIFLIKDAVLLAFGTASSEAAFPKLTQQLERFGCSNKIVSFVLPLGYSFNLDGSMMYMTFASIFIAQCYHIDLSLTQQISMLLVLMLTSKGIAGVPRASLVVISGALATFNIPEAGLLLLMGVDQFFDMGRSATNVVGNAVATVVVSKLENELTE